EVGLLDTTTGKTTLFALPPNTDENYALNSPGVMPASDGGIWVGVTLNQPDSSFPITPADNVVTIPPSNFSHISTGLLHISPAGVQTMYPLADRGFLAYIMSAPGGDLWITYDVENDIIFARLALGKKLMPLATFPDRYPHSLTLGMDHHLWIATES